MSKTRIDCTGGVPDGVTQAFTFPPEFNYRDVANDAVGQARADRLYFLRLLGEARRMGEAKKFKNGYEMLDWLEERLK